MERQMPLPQLPAYTELNKLKTHEIIARIEENIAAHNTSGGLDLKPFYNAQILFDEIARRQGNRQTLAIIVMTIIILAATLLSTYYTVRAFGSPVTLIDTNYISPLIDNQVLRVQPPLVRRIPSRSDA
jgi:hypothetical protein